MRVSKIIGGLIFIVLLHGTPINARAQNEPAATSVCDSSRHPSEFVVGARYFHINRGTVDIDDARFQIATKEGEVVAFGESKPSWTFDAFVEWSHCHESLKVETITGNRFTVAREIVFSGAEHMLDYFGKRVVRLRVPIVEGKSRASLGTRRNAFWVAVTEADQLLDSYLREYKGRPCCSPEASKLLQQLVARIDEADALLDDAERSIGEYARIARLMPDAIVLAGRSSFIAPAAWALRLQALYEHPRFKQLQPMEKATLARSFSSAATVMYAAARTAQRKLRNDADKETSQYLQQVASRTASDMPFDDLIDELKNSPKLVGDMWNLTREQGVLRNTVEGDPVRALDTYKVFFKAVPIADASVSPEVRRKVATQSALYYGTYLDQLTQRAGMGQKDYVLKVRADPTKSEYWSTFDQWLEKNASFLSGTPDEMRLLASYRALAKEILP